MRRRRTFAATAALALLSFFTLACGGLNTDEGRPIVVDTSTRWLDFERSIGVLPPGTLAAPWIIEPLDGSSAGDKITVSGLAESASRAGYPTANAAVDVYALPGEESVAESYKVGSAQMTDKGEWKLEQEVALYNGRNTIVAIARYGSVSSPEGRVVVSSSSAKAPPPGTGGGGGTTDTPKRAENAAKVRIAMVAARPAGSSFKTADLAGHMHELLNQLHDYYDADSYGAVDIVTQAVEVGGTGDGIGLPHDNAWYTAKTNKVNERWRTYVDDSLQAAKLNPADYDVIVILHPGRASQDAEGSDADLSTAADGRGPRIVMSESTDLLGGLAHEIGHQLGVILKREGGMLPDLYEDEWTIPSPSGDGSKVKYYYPFGYPGYTNLADTWKPWKRYVLMGRGNWNDGQKSPPQMTALSKSYLGWLKLDGHKNLPWTFQSPTVETMDSGAGVPAYHQPGTDTTVVIEPRSSWRWNESLPKGADDTALFVYRMRFTPPGTPQDFAMDVPPDWPSVVNGVGFLRLGRENAFYVDPELKIVCRFESMSQTSGRLKARASVSAAEPGILGQLVTLSSTLAGSILAPDGQTAPVSVTGASSQVRASSTSSGTPFSVPDLDLHCYLADGRHIGVDYGTGQFENPVKDALVSGDLVGDSEWILLPPESAKGAKYVVANNDTQRFVDVAKKNGVDVKPLEKGLDYKLTPAVLDPAKGIDHGPARKGTLAPDERATFDVVSSNESSPTIGGLTESKGGVGPPNRLEPLRLPLGIAAGALLLAAALWILIALSGRRYRAG